MGLHDEVLEYMYLYTDSQSCRQNCFNPFALRKAKILCSFGLSESNRVKLNSSFAILYCA